MKLACTAFSHQEAASVSRAAGAGTAIPQEPRTLGREDLEAVDLVDPSVGRGLSLIAGLDVGRRPQIATRQVKLHGSPFAQMHSLNATLLRSLDSLSSKWVLTLAGNPSVLTYQLKLLHPAFLLHPAMIVIPYADIQDTTVCTF